jgi:hypothetical protein
MCLTVNVIIVPTRLNANVSIISNNININTSLVSPQLKTVLSFYDTLNAHIVKYDGLIARIEPIRSKIQVSYSIRCSYIDDKYLQVTPNIVWLTPDTVGGEFDIFSNVVWKID